MQELNAVPELEEHDREQNSSDGKSFSSLIAEGRDEVPLATCAPVYESDVYSSGEDVFCPWIGTI